MSDVAVDYDSPWKQALEVFFAEFMAFFFPAADADIDWSKGYILLDKELQQAARDAELGRRYADVLARVWRRNGEDAWVLVHVEVQGQPQAEFAERMYVYNYRLYDYHQRHVASLAVLADEQVSWRPGEFGYELWGCRVSLAFPSVKLLDYRQQWSSLEESPNPFATVVMAHLKAQETRHDTAERQTWKLWLVRRLYQLGYDRQRIIGLYGFIDWVLQLAEPEASAFWHDLREIEEEKGMPYVTSVERIGIEKGLQQGLQQGRQEGQAEMVLRVLGRRLGAVPSDLVLRIRGLPDPQLLSLMDVVVTATTLPEVTAAVEALSANTDTDHQCGEMAVEALWSLAEKDPWGKSIVTLVRELPQRDDISAIATWKEKAVGLDKFYNGRRHSTGLPDMTPGRIYLRAEAESAIEMARFLLDGASGIVVAEEAKPAGSSDRDEEGLLVPYLSSIERIGYWNGQLEMVLHLFTRRFGALSSDLTLRIRNLPDSQLPPLVTMTLTATTLAEVAAAVETLSMHYEHRGSGPP